MTLTLIPLDAHGLRWAQSIVANHHYLHKQVDVRCSPMGYEINLTEERAWGQRPGCLIFGRPEATRCGEWYGSVEDVQAGRCEVTRWQVINLARVYIFGRFQGRDAEAFRPLIPGFTDRNGVWRSTLASTAINAALDSVVLDYLLAHPPCFPDEPYELVWCLSYCDTNVHKGALYRAAGFELCRENERGIQTWRKRLRPLTEGEKARVLAACERSDRSRKYRAARAVEDWQQAQLALT